MNGNGENPKLRTGNTRASHPYGFRQLMSQPAGVGASLPPDWAFGLQTLVNSRKSPVDRAPEAWTAALAKELSDHSCLEESYYFRQICSIPRSLVSELLVYFSCFFLLKMKLFSVSNQSICYAKWKSGVQRLNGLLLAADKADKKGKKHGRKKPHERN